MNYKQLEKIYSKLIELGGVKLEFPDAEHDFTFYAEHAIGNISYSPMGITYTTYPERAPDDDEKITNGDQLYECTNVVDDTDDEEAEEGLSYVKITLDLVQS